MSFFDSLSQRTPPEKAAETEASAVYEEDAEKALGQEVHDLMQAQDEEDEEEEGEEEEREDEEEADKGEEAASEEEEEEQEIQEEEGSADAAPMDEDADGGESEVRALSVTLSFFV